MPTLNIGGRTVNVGDDFLKLSPEQQNETVDEIAKSLSSSKSPAKDEKKSNAKLSDAVTDIPNEISNAFNEGFANLRGVSNRSQQGPIEGLLNTGKAVLSVPPNASFSGHRGGSFTDRPPSRAG